MMSNAKEEVRARLLEANRRYYDDGDSGLTDDEYDALAEEGRQYGLDVSTLTGPPEGTPWKVSEHLRQMSGIPDAIRNSNEWLERVKKLGLTPQDMGTASLKLDGLAVELVYSDPDPDAMEAGPLILTQAILRGDGTKGEDVFANVRRVGAVPQSIRRPTRDTISVSVTGELVISYNNLVELNRLGDREYKSPRNAVAMIRRKNARTQLLRLLRFRAIDCAWYGRGTRVHIGMTKWQPDYLSWLRIKAPVSTSPHDQFDPIIVNVVNAADAWRKVMEAEANRPNWKYQLDGIVWRRTSGEKFKLKFSPSSAVTTVRRVVEQLGRTGVIAPVIEFDPIELVHASVTRATVHNFELVKERLDGLGVGARVLVSRRGDVIPHVESVVTKADISWTPSMICPSCGSSAIQEGSIIRCSADPSDCPGTTMGLMRKFTTEIGIKGLGPGVLTAVMALGVTIPANLYDLTVDDLAEAVGPGGHRIGESVAANLVVEIQSHSSLTWGQLLGSVGIPGCARSVMTDIAQRFPDPDSLRDASVEDLMEVHGIGEERATRIASFVDTRWHETVGPLLDRVAVSAPSEGPLTGKTFCITLALKSCSRPEMEARIVSAGGIAKSSVSRKVTHLVCNIPNEGTSKLKRARELGIPIISEDELLKMMGDDSTEVPMEAAPDYDAF